ncbi:Methyltransferase domain-containing protein [Micromonospora nigra]|uniref:Methyltransferase domain-containing protein n=1 Tax=Micromonospora nigra TaxID=145857 RepID=A0A1C6SYQ4_9ACTN|nr:methyltransferase domain-containing protein [Micromonospora nigra]SCL34442.1 Methyltransferase domain-containing protein [Micromonospora nigra]
MSTWLDEWNRGQDVYVCDRHRDRHYRAMADTMVGLLDGRRGRVLDYGPGEALFADRVAGACDEVVLCEAAGSIRTRLADRFADHPRITVIGPAELAALPPGSVDLMVVHSVVQYLNPDELHSLLTTAHRLLADDGRLVVSDIIPPGAGVVADTVDLLRFAAREGFLRDTLGHLARVAVSPYARTRRRHGLLRLDEPEMRARAARAGLTGRRLRPNLGNSRSRWTFSAGRSEAAGRR